MVTVRIVVVIVSALLAYKPCDAQPKNSEWSCRECTVAMQRMRNLITASDNETAFIESFERLMTWEVKCYSLNSFWDIDRPLNSYPTCCEYPNDGRADCATKIWNHGLSNGVIDPLKACLTLGKCTIKEVQCEKE
ncbi:hypothetical protein Ddc_21823 [Ditylenchus destructor]|nr:hypothetical protein Ddc_21823 [Ditylenchus destructor]